MGDKADAARVLNDLADLYKNRSQYDKALGLYKESLQIQVDLGNMSDQGLVLNSIGAIYYYMARYEDARTYYEQALATARETQSAGRHCGHRPQPGGGLNQTRAIRSSSSAVLACSGSAAKCGRQSQRCDRIGQHGYAIWLSGTLWGGAEFRGRCTQDIPRNQGNGFWLAEVLGDYGNALAQVGTERRGAEESGRGADRRARA